MKSILMLILLSTIVGCGPSTPEEIEAARIQKVEKEKKRVENSLLRVELLKQQHSACDKNDGIKDIIETSCNKYGCDSVRVICNDGMFKEFPKVRDGY